MTYFVALLITLFIISIFELAVLPAVLIAFVLGAFGALLNTSDSSKWDFSWVNEPEEA